MCDDDIPALLKALRNQSQTFVKEKRMPLMAEDAVKSRLVSDGSLWENGVV